VGVAARAACALAAALKQYSRGVTTRQVLLITTAAATLAWMCVANAGLAAGSARFDDVWNANGATACEKFLTPGVTAGILQSPADAATKDSATSCHRGPIYITLLTVIFKRRAPS
jgi:hypothetical protein